MPGKSFSELSGKRHRRNIPTSKREFIKSAIRPSAIRRAFLLTGVPQSSADAKMEARLMYYAALRVLAKKTMMISECAGKKTLSIRALKAALLPLGRRIYI